MITLSGGGDLFAALSPLVRAEATAEAPAAAVEPRDLEQAVWLRLLERLSRQGPPPDMARWVRAVIRGEVRRARRTAARELPYEAGPVEHPGADPETGPERVVLRTERCRAIREAIRRTPGRCPGLLTAMVSPGDPTYREMAAALGMSQGSLGPIRSKCLECLRRLLAPEVAAPGHVGKEP
jgi:RNA polymerase sigma factor (sigma-70 family)